MKSRYSNSGKSLLGYAAAFGCVALALSNHPSYAGVLYWDANGSGASGNPPTASTVGGAGTWDNTALNWWDGTQYVAWGGDIADFRGSGGGVTIAAGTTVNVNEIRYSNASGTPAIGGSDAGSTLNLTGGAVINTLNYGGTNPTISVRLSGTNGIDFQGVDGGAKVVTLSANNSLLSGPITINGAVLRLGNANGFGTGAVTVNSGGQLDINTSSSNYDVTVNGPYGGTTRGNASIRFNATATFGGAGKTITLNTNGRFSGTTITSTTGPTGTIASQIVESGGSRSVEFGNTDASSENGTYILSNTGNNWTGDTIVSTRALGTATFATLQLGASGVLPNGSNLVLNGGSDPLALATLDLRGFNETINGLNSGNTHANARITNGVAGTSTLTVGAANGSGNFGGAISNGTGTVALTKTGTGTQILSGANTYTGATTVNGGVLRVNGSLGNTAVSVNNGGTFGGSGSVTGTVALNAGGKLSPGASIDTFTTGSETWLGGGSLELELKTDGTGSAGIDWDLLAINGSLDMTGVSSGSPLTIQLITMQDGTVPGFLGTWNPNVSHTWDNFLTTSSGISGYSLNSFVFDTTGFQNSLNGSFSVLSDGTNFDLVYTAVPEPSVVGLWSVGLYLLCFRSRRRQTAS